MVAVGFAYFFCGDEYGIDGGKNIQGKMRMHFVGDDRGSMPIWRRVGRFECRQSVRLCLCRTVANISWLYHRL